MKRRSIPSASISVALLLGLSGGEQAWAQANPPPVQDLDDLPEGDDPAPHEDAMRQGASSRLSKKQPIKILTCWRHVREHKTKMFDYAVSLRCDDQGLEAQRHYRVLEDQEGRRLRVDLNSRNGFFKRWVYEYEGASRTPILRTELNSSLLPVRTTYYSFDAQGRIEKARYLDSNALVEMLCDVRWKSASEATWTCEKGELPGFHPLTRVDHFGSDGLKVRSTTRQKNAVGETIESHESFDANGQLSAQRFPSQNVEMRFTYESDGTRREMVALLDGQKIAWQTYDANGRVLTSYSKKTLLTLRRRYDRVGRLKSISVRHDGTPIGDLVMIHAEKSATIMQTQLVSVEGKLLADYDGPVSALRPDGSALTLRKVKWRKHFDGNLW